MQRTILYQHPKFVATKPRQHVLLAHARLQDPGKLAQQSIAGYVPAGVIDDLELIQIEIEQRVLDTLLADAFQGAQQPLLESAPVGQAGE